MSFGELPDPIFIARPGAFHRLIEELSRESLVAVDTEANGLYAYREQVCLIQFSTPQKDYLVDVLSLDDLSPLASVFSDAKIEKVFHAAENDLVLLQEEFGFRFERLFDTMIAARILGWKSLGLGSILEAEFNIKVEKKFQRANWGRRPLPPEMVTYAQLDTHFLIPLRNRMKSALKERGRWLLALEDFTRQSRVESLDHRDDAGTVWRVNGAYDLPPQNAAVLKELCLLRDEKAQEMNRPHFKVISDKTLLRIAQECPRSVGALKRMGVVSTRQVEWMGRALIQAVQRGLSADPLHPPRSPRPSDTFLSRHDRLRHWRKYGPGLGCEIERGHAEGFAYAFGGR